MSPMVFQRLPLGVPAVPPMAAVEPQAFAWEQPSRRELTSSPSAVGASPHKVPELRLYAAILEDAWFCLTQPERVSPMTHAAAYAWLEGRTSAAPFCSFEEICTLLRLDAGAVRARLRRRGAQRAQAADSDRSIRAERRRSRARLRV